MYDPQSENWAAFLRRLYCEVDFAWFITTTFRHPQFDPYRFPPLNRSIANRMRRYFFGHDSSGAEALKFLFIAERHPLRVYGRHDFHEHILMTDPTNSKRRYGLEWDKWTNLRMSKIRNCVEGARFTNGTSYRPISNTDVRRVTGLTQLLGYLSKTEGLSDCEGPVVDWANSYRPTSSKPAGGMIVLKTS